MSDSLSAEQAAALRAQPMKAAMTFWDLFEKKATNRNFAVRALVKADLFYLLVRVCGRTDMVNQFAFERCREVEANPNGYLDLWAREHFKSSIITFGLTVQDILKDPEVTIGIFSHTRPIAKAFLRQVMREFEGNRALHAAFPDVLWGEELKDAPKWSEDDGLIVKRKSNPKEATVEAWGLVDGQPTSKHFKVLLYDDVVVRESVTSPEMIAKTMKALEESYNLGVTPGCRRRFVGTRWHYHDAYATVRDRGTAVSREHPGRVGGTEEGDSVYWPEETHLEKRRDMGPYTYAAQILLNPKADTAQGFKREWLRHFKKCDPRGMNGYILVDAASSKKKDSDYTGMHVVGLGVDRNRYVLDMVRDRLNLKERSDRLFSLHRRWSGLGLKIKEVRYERYGLMADIEHIKSRMEDENYRFTIREVGGVTSKDDRIKRLIPLFEQGQIWLPENLYYTDWQKEVKDLVRSFVEEEYMAFPFGLYRDLMDSLARMEEPDLKLVWPMAKPKEDRVVPLSIHQPQTAWMA
jgi:predicted phage terminase large subunit-like protein